MPTKCSLLPLQVMQVTLAVGPGEKRVAVGCQAEATKGQTLPWDEITPRQFDAFEKELDGISKKTMEDHYKLYEGYCKKTNECRKLLNEFDYGDIEGNQVYSQLRA